MAEEKRSLSPRKVYNESGFLKALHGLFQGSAKIAAQNMSAAEIDKFAQIAVDASVSILKGLMSSESSKELSTDPSEQLTGKIRTEFSRVISEGAKPYKGFRHVIEFALEYEKNNPDPRRAE